MTGRYDNLKSIKSAPLGVPLQLWYKYEKLNSIPLVKNMNGHFYGPNGMMFDWVNADYFSPWKSEGET